MTPKRHNPRPPQLPAFDDEQLDQLEAWLARRADYHIALARDYKKSARVDPGGGAAQAARFHESARSVYRDLLRHLSYERTRRDGGKAG